MSQPSNSKGKDAGKKYSTLNINQTFKGSKGDSKTSTGAGTRHHGLQSLGKICRKAPAPANLPSLKSENSGNDPRIHLVPSGSQGWGKKESSGQRGKQETQTPVPPGPSKSKVDSGKEISLRPNAGVGPSVKTPTSEAGDTQEGGKPTWGSKVQQQPKQPLGQTSYFQKEFPRLGVDGESRTEKDQSQGGGPDASHQETDHQAFMRTMPVPPNFQGFPPGDQSMYNGNTYPYPPYHPHMYHGQGGRPMPLPPYPYPYPTYPGPGGKPIPFDPRMIQRMMNSQMSQSERPSVVKDSALKSLDADHDKDDAGWAGAQEEVDYNAKLKFDESDESDEDENSKVNGEQKSSASDKKDERARRQEAWPDYPNAFPPSMAMPLNQQTWARFPYYDPQRGPPPPSGPPGYPFHPMYFMYGFPPQGHEKPDSQKHSDQRNVSKPEDKKGIERKAKLHDIEEKIKKRTQEEQRHLEELERHHTDKSRSRNDSEASDSSRREVPPRFRKQPSTQSSHHQPSERTRTISETSQMKIMKRKDSIKSDEEYTHQEEIFKKPELQKVTAEKQDQNLETSKSSDLPKKQSLPLESSERSKSSRHGSLSSVHSKEDTTPKSSQKELRDLSDKQGKSEHDNKRKEKKEDHFSDYADGKALTVNSGRFAVLKLTKGQAKRENQQERKPERSLPAKSEVVEQKNQSPWSKVVSGETGQSNTEENKKSFHEIQREEEQEEQKNRRSKEVETISEDTVAKPIQENAENHKKERRSPDQNQFRTDFYEKKPTTNPKHSREDRHKNRGRFVSDDSYNRRNRYDRDDKARRDSYRKERRDGYDSYKDRKDDNAARTDEKKESGKKEVLLAKDEKKDFEQDMKGSDLKKDDDKKTEKRDSKRYEKKEEYRKSDRRKEEKRRDDSRKSERKYYDRYERGDENRKYTKRDEPRKDFKRDDHVRSESRDYYSRKDDRRPSRYDNRNDRKDTYRHEKDTRRGSERYGETKSSEGRSESRSERDSRQSEEYKRDSKEKKERKIKDDEQGTVITETKETDSGNDVAGLVDEVNKSDKQKKEEAVVSEKTTFTGTSVKDNVKSFGQRENRTSDSGEVRRSRNMGRSQENKQRNDYETNRGYDNRGRGRGRGSSRGGGRSQVGKGDDFTDRRSKNRDGNYENETSGEYTRYDEQRGKSRSTHHDSVRKMEHKNRWENETPPRFQHSQDGRGSRRGAERGRGHSRGRGRSLISSRSSDGNVGFSDEKRTTESFDDKYSPEDFDGSDGPYVAERVDHHSRSNRYGNHSTHQAGRGSKTSALKDGKDKSSFLVKRQQVGKKRTSLENKDTLSAADKFQTMKGSEFQSKQETASKNSMNLEDISAHSPPKKAKPIVEKKVEKKRDISREYDINNTKSVVCIDYIPETNTDQNTLLEEGDGFVTVTSKKQQRELRDRQREEEKRRAELEQRREKEAAAKTFKITKKDASKNIANVPKGKPASFIDAPISSVGVDQIISATPSSIMVSPPAPASNAAMAAIGDWEPAQYLSRSQASSSDQSKLPLSTVSPVNAWQRPLSLNAPIESAIPDPRAVGTGKPSSSHPGLMSKSTLVPMQPTPPEAASPLVTPPALAPIGTSSLNNIPNGITANLKPAIKPEKVLDISVDNVVKVEKILYDQEPERKRGDKSDKSDRGNRSDSSKRDSKVSSKRAETRPPRFQSNSRKETDERSIRFDEKKRQLHGDMKSRKKPADRYRKSDSQKVITGSKQIKTKSTEKEKAINEEDNVFSNDISPNDSTMSGARKSKLSDADKVVGSNKPSLKSQSSIGSYSGSVDHVEENIIPVNICESFKAPPTASSMCSEEDGAKDTARSVIKSLNDDEERSLETRSLPGTPPLAVKIPEPTLSGPSSDPGRGPSPSVVKGHAASMSQEVSDLNRRLLSAKSAWDSLPTTWSDVAAVSSSVTIATSSSTISPSQSMDKSSQPGSPTKPESVVTPTEINLKSEEKIGSVNTFAPKRSEQQVCKVKPQQQIPQDAIKQYTNGSIHHVAQRGIPSSKFASYVLPVERQLSSYTDQFRTQASQALGFQSIGPVRSIDAVSPISQQLMSSFPVSSMYGTTLQPSQNQMLAWQVVSTGNVQPAKTLTYQNPNQASLFSSSGSIGNSPLIMQYGSSFSPQRTAGNLQQQRQLGVVQVPPQQQQTTVNLVNTSSQVHVRRSPRYQTLTPDTAAHLNQSQMAMITDPHSMITDPHSAAAAYLSQQMTHQQRSDLMKHVNAKPFEPTSQTPPLVHSPPVAAQQQVQPLHHNQQHAHHHQQQQLIASVMNQHTSGTRPQFVQNISHYSQPVMPQRQHNVQSVHHNPLIAPVRPQVQGRLMTGSNPTSHSNRVHNISPFNPTLATLSTAIKNHPSHNSNVQFHLQQRAMNNHFSQPAHQQQRNGMRVGNVLPQTRTSGPGPIQRPANQGHQPLVNQVSINYPVPILNSSESDFKKIQRQKMLEDTKRYFAQDQQPAPKDSSSELIRKDAPETTLVTNPELSKHDKFILPDSTKELKKHDTKRPRADMKPRNTRRGVLKNGTSGSKKLADGKQRNSAKI